MINPVSTSRKKSLLGDLEVILREEEIHWKQKAKCKWLKEGDNNTKFFHKVACSKKQKNMVTRIKIQGVDMMDVEVIKEEADCFFSKLYSKYFVDRPIIDNFFSSRLSEECVLQLEAPFSEEKVKEVVFSMDKDKSRSPNGFFTHFLSSLLGYYQG